MKNLSAALFVTMIIAVAPAWSAEGGAMAQLRGAVPNAKIAVPETPAAAVSAAGQTDSCDRVFMGSNYEDPRSAASECGVARSAAEKAGYEILAIRTDEGKLPNHEPVSYCTFRYRLTPQDCADARRQMTDEEVIAAVDAKAARMGSGLVVEGSSLPTLLRLSRDDAKMVKLIRISDGLDYGRLPDGGYLIIKHLMYHSDYCRYDANRRSVRLVVVDMYGELRNTKQGDTFEEMQNGYIFANALRDMRGLIKNGFFY